VIYQRTGSFCEPVFFQYLKDNKLFKKRLDLFLNLR